MALCVLMKSLEDADLPLLTNRELTDEVQQQGMTSSPRAEVIEIPCKDNALQKSGESKGSASGCGAYGMHHVGLYEHPLGFIKGFEG